MPELPIPTKLIVMIVSDNDSDRLMNRLVEDGLPATKIGSSGGFLRRGNATILSGVAALLTFVSPTTHSNGG